MNYQVICNPVSGNGSHVGRLVAQLLTQNAMSPVIQYTKAPFEAISLACEAAAQGADTVIVIGGDGTIHEAAEGLQGSKTALGIIPAGTGNDFIKTIRVPADPEAAFRLILEGQPHPVDTVRINDRLFLNECGCGFDVMVLDYAEKAKKYAKGILPYLHGVIQTIFHYSDIRISCSIDDGPAQEKNILVLAVGNGRYIGGGIPIAPNAVPDDGKLDVLMVDGMKKARMFRALPGLLKGKIQSFPETTHQYAQRLRLRGSQLRVNIDGEIITLDEADIEIIPASLYIYRP